jgi:hypothetical protein
MNEEFDNTSKQLEKLGSIKVVEIKDNKDGTSNIVFDVDKNFIKNYNHLFHLAEWDQVHFENTVIEAINNMVDKQVRKQMQNPDFLWTLPKDENE